MSQIIRTILEGLGEGLDKTSTDSENHVEEPITDSTPIEPGTIRYEYLLGRLSNGLAPKIIFRKHFVPKERPSTGITS